VFLISFLKHTHRCHAEAAQRLECPLLPILKTAILVPGIKQLWYCWGASCATIEPSFLRYVAAEPRGKYRNRSMIAISAWVFAVSGVDRRAYRRVLRGNQVPCPWATERP